MRIASRRAASRQRTLKQQLAHAAKSEPLKGRVCGAHCTVRCPQCGSLECQCRCAATCPEAPYVLSSDPSRHPIEPGVVPLVFEMKRHGLFHPCWSCEGHLGSDGAVVKLPRVWFYTDAAVHLRLLSGALSSLKFDGALSSGWHVTVAYSDPANPETTFSLEPLHEPGAAPSLPRLQADMQTLARALAPTVAAEATRLRVSLG